MKTMRVRQQLAFQKIIFATDFEAFATRALPFAVALAHEHHARLYIAHVIPRDAYAYAHPESLDRILREAQDEASFALRQIGESLRRRGIHCETLLGVGNVAQVLTNFVQQYSADVVVLATKSRTGVGKVFLGSIAEEVIRDAPCPVLTVGPRVSTETSAATKSILCAIDFSPESIRAADVAASLAGACRARLTLVHVVVDNSSADAKQLINNRIRQVISGATELPQTPEVVVETGPPAERILKIASNVLADMIVMGVRGAGAFAETASRFGSIAHKILSQAACPVLTVGALPQAADEQGRERSDPVVSDNSG